MEVPCVRVRPQDGERTRAALADRDLVHDGYEITVEDGWLYVPLTDAGGVGPEYDVTTHDLPVREGQTLPGDLLGFEPAYERIGTIAIVDEDSEGQSPSGSRAAPGDSEERARAIADAIVESDLPLDSVVNRASKVKGELRVRDWEVLAGGTETVHREYGFEYALDLATVYFSPRLATERHRVTEQAVAGENALDLFAGVGPFVIPFAARGAEAVGVDLNPAAVAFMRGNAERNGVGERVTAIEGDVRELSGYDDWADRLVMNLPHSADAFLDTAVRLAGDDCTLHYYDIQSDEDPFGPGEAAIRAAAEPEYEVTVETRHVVRSYAPHEENVCLDVRLTRRG